MGRAIDHRYDDPLDLIWLHAVARLGWRVERSPDVFAAWDGASTLTIGTSDDLDPDDNLAQLLFHEICHALVEAAATGDAALALPDWGLCNRDERHLDHEHACHRLQAALADEHGLRRFLAPTTEHRPYYDGLPADPLQGPADDPAVACARAGVARARHAPFADALDAALAATAAVGAVVAGLAPERSLWREVGPAAPARPASSSPPTARTPLPAPAPPPTPALRSEGHEATGQRRHP